MKGITVPTYTGQETENLNCPGETGRLATLSHITSRTTEKH